MKQDSKLNSKLKRKIKEINKIKKIKAWRKKMSFYKNKKDGNK